MSRWTFLDSVNWGAMIAHEVKFADMPRIGNPPGFGPLATPRQADPDDDEET